MNIPVIVNNRDPLKCQDTTTPAWYDEYHSGMGANKSNLISIRRDNKYEACSELPVISTTNTRSLIPKINNYILDMKMRGIDIAFCSETWLKKDKNKHKFQLEKILLQDGYKCLSTSRPVKRGGGCALIVDLSRFTVEKLDIPIPHNLEVCLGLVRPINPTSNGVKSIICISFYSPPKSRKKNKLIDFILTQSHILLTKYPKAGLVISGDKNDTKISPMINVLPGCKQIVTENTHGNKCLDIIIMNYTMHCRYQIPEIVPPVLCDIPSTGQPSDHSVPVTRPITGLSGTVIRQYTTRTSRPMPDSAIREFGEWIVNEDWNGISDECFPDEQLLQFSEIINPKIDEISP